MRRSKLAIGSLTACAALLAVGPAACAQEDERDDRRNRGAEQRDRDGGPDRAQGDERRRRGDGEGGRRGGSGEERREAVAHFLAGYYAGYTDGWVDGSDELVIGLVGQQRDRSRRMAEKGQDADRMQPGRRAVREQMCGRMRGDSGENRSRDRRASAVTVRGEIVAMKTVPIKNAGVEHRVVRVETENGDLRVVDLGPTGQTERLDLGTGDRIEVRGVRAVLGDMRIVAARQVTADGEQVNVKYKKLRREGRGDKAGSGRSERDRDAASDRETDDEE